jgi:peptidyl-prolyl cis-trans isomerase D
MRIDEVLPQRPAAYEDVAGQVADRWRAEQIVTGLRSLAQTSQAQMEAGTPLSDLGMNERVETGQIRSGFIAATPRGFMGQVFEMEPGEVRIIEGTENVVLVRLDAINPASDTAEAEALVAQLRSQQNEALARGLYEIFAEDALLRAGQNIDPRAVNAVHVNFQ